MSVCWFPSRNLSVAESDDGYGWGCGHVLVLRLRDAEKCPRPVRHPPVRLAEELHQRRDEEGADDSGIEDDPGSEANRERFDLVAGARREHEEREHQDQRGARHELARACEAEL